MPKINPIHWRKLAKVFERSGWMLDRIEGDHLVYAKFGCTRPVVIPKVKRSSGFYHCEQFKNGKNFKKRIF